MLSSLMTHLFAGVLAGTCAQSIAPPPLVADADLEAAGMERYWEAALPLAPGSTVIKGYLVDDNLYVITDDGTLFTLEASVGLIRWADRVTERNYTIYRPSHMRTKDGKGPVIVPTTSVVHLFNRYTGEELKQFAPPYGAGSSAVGYDALLFMGSASGRFYCLQVFHSISDEPFKVWEVKTGGPVTASPVLFGPNTLIFSSQDGGVYSCRAYDKALNWSFRAGGIILGDLAVDESGVYVASLNRSLYKVDHTTGRAHWRLRLPQPLEEGPVVMGPNVYQYCPHYGLVAVDPEHGVERWRDTAGRTVVSHASAGDLILTDGHDLEVVNPLDGTVLHTITAPAVALAVQNTQTDAAFLLGSDGRVLCARLSSVPYLRRQQVTAARNRLNLPPVDAAAAIKRTSEVENGKKKDALEDPLRSKYDRHP